MKLRKKMTVLLLACAALGMTACGDGSSDQKMEPVEGLEKLGNIQVIAREEGSGTRSTFAQLADFETEGQGEQNTDLTREDARIENNAGDVIQAVKADIAAIGYVSRGAVADGDDVKILSIDGKSVDDDSVRYPLSRSFYLAYMGKLRELEQDFLMYVHGAGQEIVGKDYEPVGKSSSFLSNKATGTIRITGSSSVAPLVQKLAQDYQKKNPNAGIEVSTSDSSDGLMRALTGKCDLAMSSRELMNYEKELLDYELIAHDNIAVIVNKDNPVNNLTLDILKKIYTGELKNWSEINEQ